jgi:hypothetical protein
MNVKNSILLTCLFFICLANAQKIRYGFSIGLNRMAYEFPYNQIDNISDDVIKARGNGLVLGALARITLNNKWQLKPEIDGVSIVLGGLRTYVVHVPIMVRYRLNEQFHLFGGPSLNYLTYNYAPERFKLNADFGLAFQFDDYFDVAFKYSYGPMGQATLSGAFISLEFAY